MSQDWDVTAQRVGWIAIESARLEYAMASLEITMIGTERAAAVVMGQGWVSHQQACLAMVKSRIEEETAAGLSDAIPTLSALVETIKAADLLMVERSHVVHALWSEPDLGSQETLQFRRWGQLRVRDWTPDTLHQLRADLNAAAQAVGLASLDLAGLWDEHSSP